MIWRYLERDLGSRYENRDPPLILQFHCDLPTAGCKTLQNHEGNLQKKQPGYSTWCSSLLHSTQLKSTQLFSALRYATLLYPTLLYCTPPHGDGYLGFHMVVPSKTRFSPKKMKFRQQKTRCSPRTRCYRTCALKLWNAEEGGVQSVECGSVKCKLWSVDCGV